MNEIYELWLSELDLENHIKLKLLNENTAEEIWQMDLEEFLKNSIPEGIALKIVKSKNLELEKRKLEYMQKNGIKLISVKDERYPQKLHNIENKPAFLYVRGNENILDEDSVRNGGM